jgi:hypothetical protein
VVSVDGAYATGTTAIPLDNSIPQSTEGTQFISLSITPTNSNSKLLIEVVATHTSSAADWISGAIFQDSTANALAATASYMDTAGGGAVLTLQHYMTAGTTSSTTFKYRAGLGGAGTIGFKGSASINWFGGLTVGRMTITEIAA